MPGLTPPSSTSATRKNGFLLFFCILALLLTLFFCKSFEPNAVVFSNDGPLGGLVAAVNHMPDVLLAAWHDINWVGNQSPTPAINITSMLRLATNPVLFAKIFPAFSLFILGLGAWFCFRQIKLTPLACLLGGLAAALSSHFLSTACWGVASQTIGIGMDFVALGLLYDDSAPRQWLRTILAGMAVGMNIMEAYDIGAIFSLYVAAFVIFRSFQSEGTTQKRILKGVLNVAVIALFAAFLSTEALMSLVGTQIKGVAGMEQDTASKARRWDEATQWSFPKGEILRIVIPGLFGYRMDTPKDMEAFQSLFEGGVYWGKVGETPGWSEHRKDPEWLAQRGGGLPRFSGGGEYAGVLVVAVALWAIFQSLRKKDSVFTLLQRKYIWFWAIAAFVSLLFAFGRYAPFYQLIYMLPYFSTIRNPAKFTHPFNWSLIILFAYGIHGLCRRYLVPAGAESSSAPDLSKSAKAPSDGTKAKGAGKSSSSSPSATPAAKPSLSAHLKSWWAKANSFDKKWVRGSGAAIGASLLGLLIYAASRSNLEQYLREVGFPDPGSARQIAGFSIREVFLFIVVLVLTLWLLVLVISGRFSGPRARLGGGLLGVLLVADLARANLPWIIYWNYKEKYATNPVVEALREKPYEHRVALFPSQVFIQMDRLPPQQQQIFTILDGVYKIEWAQHHFQYYNIQSLDVVQMPRRPIEYETFETNLLRTPLRRWQLTNTRYLLAPAMLLDFLNTQIDPAHRPFRILTRFDIVPKPGETVLRTYDQFMAVANTNGQYAVFEYTSALPRASLYTNWQISTNDQTTIQTLMSPSFDPAQTVLVDDARVSASTNTNTNQAAGTVDFVSYAPKHVVLHAKAAAKSILLLNDKYDPNWKVTVDGKAEPLFKCNYLMRGVQLSAGEHQIDYRFEPPITGLYVSLAAIVLGLGLIGFLAIPRSTEPAASSAPPASQPKAENHALSSSS